MMTTKVFIETVKNHEQDNPFCPYACRIHHLFHIGYSCLICGDFFKYKHLESVNPCSLQDFKGCPLFPHSYLENNQKR